MSNRSLALDGIVFSLQRHGGISVYFRQLMSRLSRDGIDTDLTWHEPALQDRPVESQSLRVHPQPQRRFERYRRCLTPAKAAVFHSTYYRKPVVKGLPTVVTVHDFAYERCNSGPRLWVHSAQKNAAIRAAQTVICISEATRQDLLEFVGEVPGQVVHVIHNGVADDFKPVSAAPAEKPFMLFVGQRGGYKNFKLALDTLALIPDLDLHCVGGGEMAARELASLPSSVCHRVHHLGTVSDRELNLLYNQAVCLFYPSIYEGFGIPVIEAMRAGCPVVSSPCRAILEVGLHALTVVPATDAHAAAAGVLGLRDDRERRLQIVEAGIAVASRYSWEKTYQQTLSAYVKTGLPIQDMPHHS
jgi:mannosyltransferase